MGRLLVYLTVFLPLLVFNATSHADGSRASNCYDSVALDSLSPQDNQQQKKSFNIKKVFSKKSKGDSNGSEGEGKNSEDLKAQNPPQMSEEATRQYKEAFAAVKQLEKKAASLQTATPGEIIDVYNEALSLDYDYDPMEMTEAAQQSCEKLKVRIENLKEKVTTIAQEKSSELYASVYDNSDKLLEKTECIPMFLEKGDVLHYHIVLQQHLISFQTVFRSAWTKSATMKDSLVVRNQGIYMFELNPVKTQYASINIYYKGKDFSRYSRIKEVKSEEVACTSKDYRAVGSKGISMKQAFEQPRKFTLRGQLKSMLSGSSVALVAIPVPEGATDVLYSMRISTSEQDKRYDGHFSENMDLAYMKIRFLGLPLYEQSVGSGLINTLLSYNKPPREEEAYCNMYVFRNSSYAKKFQDGASPSQLPYDVDYSTLGTQSCSGRIPVKGAKTIYLAFENERVRYSNYLWVEAIIVQPKTEYHRTRYYVE